MNEAVSNVYEERQYRNFFKSSGLKFFNVCVFETDLCIGATADIREIAEELVKTYRTQLRDYIKTNRLFLESLTPIEAKHDAPEIAARMCSASTAAGVGPMAAVAGAISEMVGTRLLKYSQEIIVENGGDIFIKTSSLKKVGIYAGKSPLSERLAIEIKPEDTPLGLCTSSGTVGHSLSFGRADAVVIISKDVFLADAVATATGNMIKNIDDIDRAVEFASSIRGIEGVLVIMGEKLAAFGNIALTRF